MSAGELALRVLAQVEPLLPYMLAVAASTAAALAVLLASSRGLWVNERRFRRLGLFYGLRRGECACLACAWIKLALLFCYLIGFKKLSMAHYLLFLIPGGIYALWPRRPERIPARVLWLALESVGLLCCNLICGYIRDLNAGVRFMTVYVLMAIFVALFGVYLFLTELDDISAGRSADLEREQKEGERGE